MLEKTNSSCHNATKQTPQYYSISTANKILGWGTEGCRIKTHRKHTKFCVRKVIQRKNMCQINVQNKLSSEKMRS